jgi:hypothetical protein
MTIRPRKIAGLNRPILITILVAISSGLASAQIQPVVLEIDVENLVEYIHNTHFWEGAIRLGDITAVNGHPVKGTYVGVPLKLGLTPAPQPGQPVADITRVSFRQESFQILGLDGVPVGSILTLGTAGGPSLPAHPRPRKTVISQLWAVPARSSAFGAKRAAAF